MQSINFRRAVVADLPTIVEMLADDPLGAERESVIAPLDRAYSRAFDAIEADPNQLLAVATIGEEIVGTLQLTVLPGLSRKGAWRGQIEAVRIASSRRGEGLGKQFFAWAIDECRSRGCRFVQLTTDSSRADAHRFYEQLGFVGSHIGYKLTL